MSDTIDIRVDVSDGWVALATNPIGLNIKSNGIGRWHFAAMTGVELPHDALDGEIREGISSRYVESFDGIVYIRVITDDHDFSITDGIGATHTTQSNGVPGGFTKVTTTTVKQNVSKGQLTKVGVFPRIGNEHVESSREIQGVVSDGNILGQIFKASKDNITALMLTLESAAGISVDDFESYVDSTALQAVWIPTGAPSTLELGIVSSGVQAMHLPTTNTGDEWQRSSAPFDYTDYTGVFASYFSHGFSQQQVSVFIGDGTNTKSFLIVQEGPGIWCTCEVNEKAMTEDQAGTTDVTAITEIGYRVITKKLGGFVIIDDLLAVPAPGNVELKLWNMGVNLPEAGVVSIDDGDQYTQLGEAQAASYSLPLEGGVRLYHIDAFTAGADKSIPTNELLKIDHYYLIELKWIDTEVNVYGPDTSFAEALGTSYYNNGYAFTTPDEATAVAQIGKYSDLMFAILSTQDVYILSAGWRFDAAPNGQAEISVFLEDDEMKVSDTIVDREHSPEESFISDVSLRPQFLSEGGKLEYYYNDDYTDGVTTINVEMRFLYEPPTVNG